MSRLDPSEEPGVWRFARATRARVVIDGEDYFACMQQAMLRTQKRILLVGWDFDTRIHLGQGRKWWQRSYRNDHPARLGSFFAWLVRHRPGLDIRILKWSYGLLTFFKRGAMWIDVIRWMIHSRITFKFDTAHPVACSHHQKIVVLDDRMAVCGGIDMTDGRWDTREHVEDDPKRKSPWGIAYGPWHDASMMMEGDIALALSELCQDRWIRAGGEPLEQIEPPEESPWPEGLEAHFKNVEIGIARTRAKFREWDGVDEIEQLYVQHIKRAKRLIYAESQYFASRVVAEAILSRVQEDDPPEIVVVHPAHADGWLEMQAMDHARAELVRCIEEADHKGRFSIWNPFTGETAIYVHAKIMIVDDEILRIGSANLNNRSMGLDSECDVFIDAAREGNGHAAEEIGKLRHSLLGEHCGLDYDDVPEMLERFGSMATMIDHSQEDQSRRLVRYHPPDLNDAEENLAESQFLDPESPDEMFEPFAKGGLFRKGSRLDNIRRRMTRNSQG
ncbi:phospholipase D-like domain-containing protein [Qipengyuania marisflavi]|uniref:phospholipase D-like domain-containing protein n=1 Tax=Qipengyuania marisflavi TaxID=2486356 RepID=UPI001FE5C38F|nr:phospholipase D-like domain-containing protein [Qipengyuania marisflavi]